MCKTALVNTHCLVLFDTELLDKVFSIDSNLSLEGMNEDGSNLAPPLRPRPWEAGTFSLTPPLIYFDWQGTVPLAWSQRQFSRR